MDLIWVNHEIKLNLGSRNRNNVSHQLSLLRTNFKLTEIFFNAHSDFPIPDRGWLPTQSKTSNVLDQDEEWLEIRLSLFNLDSLMYQNKENTVLSRECEGSLLKNNRRAQANERNKELFPSTRAKSNYLNFYELDIDTSGELAA